MWITLGVALLVAFSRGDGHYFLAMIVTTLLPIFAGLFLIQSLYRISPRHPLSHIRGPILPRISSLFLTYHAWIGDECTTVHNLHKIYGPVVRTGPNSVDIADGAALQEIYNSKAGGFKKADFYANFDIDGHKSIFSEVNPEARAIRAKAVASMFATASLRKDEHIIQEIVSRFVKRLSEQKDRAKTSSRKVVNLLPLTRGLAADAVTGYLFGRTFGALYRIDELTGLEEITKAAAKSGSETNTTANGMVDAFVAVGRFWYLPPRIFKWVEWYDSKFGSGKRAGVGTSFTIVDNYLFNVVSDAKMAVKQDSDQEPISSSSVSVTTASYPAKLLKAGISESETRAQCKDLIFAGTDSTGMNLATIFWYLARNPTSYDTLKKEIDSSTDLSYDTLQNRPYLRAVIREGLRLSMANPSRLPRVVPSEGWTFKKTKFPAGTVVSCTPFELHLNPEVYPDPISFKPERWLETGKQKKSRMEEMNRDLIAFGLGPRQCIARNLATVELYLAVARAVKADIFKGAKAVGSKIEILEWFNSKVKDERIEIEFT